MTARCVVVASTILLLAGGPGVGDDKKDEQDKVQGEWAVVSVEIGGQKREGDEVKNLKLVIKGSAWTAPTGQKFTFKIDPAKSPKQLDLILEPEVGKEMTWRGIYKIEGDTLTF